MSIYRMLKKNIKKHTHMSTFTECAQCHSTWKREEDVQQKLLLKVGKVQLILWF